MTVRPNISIDQSRPLGGTPGLTLVDWRTDTLVDLLRRRAAETPSMVLYTFLEDGETREKSMTAAELACLARRIGATLQKLVKKPGARVILLFEDGLDYIAGLFGCLSAGLVAVSGIHPAAPGSTERFLGIARDCAADIVIGQGSVLAEFQRALDDVLDDFDLRWVATDRIKAAPPESWIGAPAQNSDLALIQYTSGSSRAPRGVMLTHRNVLHNLRGQMEVFCYQPGDTGVSWLPFSHDMGLIGCVLMAVYGGGRCVLLSPSHFLEDPLRWLRAIARYRATLSAGPNFAYDLCVRRAETLDVTGLDLSSWAVAVSGAEPVRADVLRRFAQTFAPARFKAEALHPSYGLAEATLLVASGERLAPARTRSLDKAALRANRALPLASAENGIELVGCGAGMPDQRIVIVDPKTLAPAAPGEIGEIWVAGPSISAGYFGRAEENAAYFAGDLHDGHGPYLRTGDLGFVLDGDLFITGRWRDLLIVRGKNYYPQDVEHSAEASHEAIRPGCSAAFIEEETGDLVVVAELLRTRHDEAVAASGAVREAIVRDHGINPRKIVLAAWGAVLKTPSGKVQRAKTRAAYAERQLAIVHETVLSEAKQSIKAVEPADFGRIEDWFLAKMRANGIDVASFEPKMRLTELGFDSLKIVELKADLERDLGIVVHVADLYEFQDLQSLADYLRSAAFQNRDAQAKPEIPAAPKQNRLADQRKRRADPASEKTAAFL